MNHSFNINLAKKYGIEEAILIENFIFWIKKNIANQKHFYDGRYWTYNSAKAMAQLFPYMNDKKIYRIIDNLCKINFLLKGNYNTDPFVKTLWYSFSDEAIEVLGKEGYDITKIESPFPENGNSYTDINNTDNKEDNIIILSKKAEDNAEHVNVKSLLESNNGVKKCSKKSNNVNSDIDYLYDLYPTKCPNRGQSTGKCRKDKDKIKSLLKNISKDELEFTIKSYVKQQNDEGGWLKNFSTFLNQLPDMGYGKDADIIDGENSNSSYLDGRLQELDEKIEKYK